MPLGWGCGKDAGVAVPSLPGEECKLPRKLICPPYSAARRGWCCGCQSQLFFSFFITFLSCFAPNTLKISCLGVLGLAMLVGLTDFSFPL